MIAKYEQRALSAKNHTSIHRYLNLQNLPHWHMEHELIYVSKGKINLVVNNTPYLLKENESVFVKSEDIHFIKAESGSVTEVMKIQADSVRHIVGGYTLAEPRLSGQYPIKETFADILEEQKSGQLFSEIISSGLMVALVAKIFRGERKVEHTMQKSASDHQYKELLEILQKEFRHITFDEAAKFMHFSKPYFSTYFYNRTGMTFTHYLNMLRVAEASKMVVENELRMTEISDRCGFGTIRSFNRLFKEFTGYNPKELPHDYVFLYNMETPNDTGFDPTLNCTILLD